MLGNGQLGSNSPTPVAVQNFTNIGQVSTGGYHAMALKTSGEVWSSGGNGSGQVGTGVTPNANAPSPIQVPITNVRSVAAGGISSYTLKNDGTVWAWGDNSGGQLGFATCSGGPPAYCTGSIVPLQVAGLSNIIAISAGAYHALALDSSGRVWSWGWNANGQLGIGNFASPITTPGQVTGLGGYTVRSIAAGDYDSYALTSTGKVLAWGAGQNGTLGNGAVADSNLPVQVIGLPLIASLPQESSAFHAGALAADGSVWLWGRNDMGELGTGSACSPGPCGNSVPTKITGIPSVPILALGAWDTLINGVDNSIWVWGENSYGELANGTTCSPSTCLGSATPLKVNGLSGTVTSAAAGYFFCAITMRQPSG